MTRVAERVGVRTEEVPPTVVPAPGLAGAVAAWRRELAGLGGPEPLMSARDLQDGSLDVATAHPSGIAMLMAGRPTRLSHLFREPGALADARSRARAIRQTAAALADEHGLRACVLAVGLASWRQEGGRVVSTPVLLRPVELRPRGSGAVDYEVDLGGPVRTNPALVRELSRRGVPLDPQALAALAGHAHGFDPTPSLERLRALVRSHAPDVEVRSALVVTALVDVAPALVGELERLGPELARSDVALALSGDAAARARLHDPAHRAAPPTGRAVSTEDVRVLALDHHQRQVVDAVLAGRSLRVEAGPGTGATQVVAASVAALAASGRRVLLVAGQQAEAEDVARRLAGLGLADLVVDPAGPLEASATGQLARVHVEPERVSGPAGDPVAELHGQHRALHAVRAPWGVSALDALHALSRLEGAATEVRLSESALRHLDARTRERTAEQLHEAVELGGLTVREGDTAWTGAALTSGEDATAALVAVRRLRGELLPALRKQAAALARDAGLRGPVSVEECAEQLELLITVRDSLDGFLPAVFERPLTDLVNATATSAERAETGARMGFFHRRRLERDARALVRPGVVPVDLHASLVSAESARVAWADWQARDAVGALPRVPQGLPSAEVLVADVLAEVELLDRVLERTEAGGGLATAPWPQLGRRLSALAEDAGALEDLPRRTSLMTALRERGLSPLLDDLRARQVSAEDAVAALEVVWWRSVLDAVMGADPALARLDPARRAQLVAALGVEERRRAGVAVHRVRDATALAGTPPCRVTSPLALPHEVPPAERQDVVVLVAAHRIGVPEAVLAMAAGRQVLVVGDPGGLPVAPVAPRPGAPLPTARPSVFSVLDGVLPSTRLECQHRMPAQLARLAALVPGVTTGAHAVPAAPDARPARLELVAESAGRPDEDGVVESPDGEVARVVDLVSEHARTRPGESLAVVALTRPHARRIADAVRDALPDRPELAAFLTARRGEPFVVTDVERCADTVRDAVIFTLGYGVTPLGRFVHRLGPLDGEGGHRRLAAALTRARQQLVLVSCLGADALEEDRLRSEGGRSLRRVLAALADEDQASAPVPEAVGEPSASEGAAGEATETGATDPLLAVLAERLGERGLRVVSGADVPELIVLPADSDAPAVAVLTDLPDDPAGAGQGGASAGDLLQHELLLPEELERFGWRTVRVGALDLFTDPAATARRVARELDGAR